MRLSARRSRASRGRRRRSPNARSAAKPIEAFAPCALLCFRVPVVCSGRLREDRDVSCLGCEPPWRGEGPRPRG
eukprot:992976-Alexandrium_andersonii.AAC.1